MKVRAEHKIYEAIGQEVVRVWRYFGLFDKGAYLENEPVLGEKARDYGRGKGYIKTLAILWAITIMTDAILIAIGIIVYSI